MSPSEQFLLAKAVIIIVMCAGSLFLKFGLVDESSDFSGKVELLQENSDELILRNSENLSAERRRELLEKIKEERIKDYLYQKKRKFT
jgi:23S rRNA maturation-related 3'-5' exoribonuclease YhaM